ncbi:SGNH hydrolase superfamily protein [Pleurotus pulmonarius]
MTEFIQGFSSPEPLNPSSQRTPLPNRQEGPVKHYSMAPLDTRQSFPSKVFGIARYWPGYSPDLKHIVVSGASYCDVGYSHQSPHPTPEHPLGVPFPGYTYAEDGQANWVGHLVTEHPPQSAPQGPHGSPVLVYDYAKGGATVHGVVHQVNDGFMRAGSAGWKPEWAHWNSNDTIFMTWVGINDCALTRADRFAASMKVYFEAQEAIYSAGGRNFVFINVPPVGRFRGKTASNKDYETWNKLLEDGAASFATANPDATVMIFSAWDLFHDVMDHPDKYGFTAEKGGSGVGGFLVDGLHPTSKMHNIIAREISVFLRAQLPT